MLNIFKALKVCALMYSLFFLKESLLFPHYFSGRNLRPFHVCRQWSIDCDKGNKGQKVPQMLALFPYIWT